MLSLPRTGFSKVKLSGLTEDSMLISPGTAFRDLKDVNVYPCIGMKRPQAQMTVNFGQRPFVFDIDEMMRVSAAPCIKEETLSRSA